MAKFNPYFWEVPTDFATLDRVADSDGLYYETEAEQDRRHALGDFFREVGPSVSELIDSTLTPRQREVVKLYYYYDKTQEDIAIILQLTQSTVSRHLFGTSRAGKKVGGAIPKLRKVLNKTNHPTIDGALDHLQKQLAKSA